MGNHKNKTKRLSDSSKIKITIILIIILFVLIAYDILIYFYKQNDNINSSVIPNNKSQTTTVATANNTDESQLFAVSINSKIYVNKDNTALAYIKNDKSNEYNMQVKIKDSSTGDMLYESEIIKPGSEIDSITLKNNMKVGNNNAAAEFYALDVKTGKIQGNVIVDVVFIVENK